MTTTPKPYLKRAIIVVCSWLWSVMVAAVAYHVDPWSKEVLQSFIMVYGSLLPIVMGMVMGITASDI